MIYKTLLNGPLAFRLAREIPVSFSVLCISEKRKKKSQKERRVPRDNMHSLFACHMLESEGGGRKEKNRFYREPLTSSCPCPLVSCRCAVTFSLLKRKRPWLDGTGWEYEFMFFQIIGRIIILSYHCLLCW